MGISLYFVIARETAVVCPHLRFVSISWHVCLLLWTEPLAGRVLSPLPWCLLCPALAHSIWCSVSSWANGSSQCHIYLGLFLVLQPPSGMEELNWELGGPDWVSPVPISWPLARAASWGVSFHVAESENWPNRKAGDSPRCSRISEEWPPCFLLFHVHHTASGL